jgi:hypothetical protein
MTKIKIYEKMNGKRTKKSTFQNLNKISERRKKFQKFGIKYGRSTWICIIFQKKKFKIKVKLKRSELQMRNINKEKKTCVGKEKLLISSVKSFIRISLEKK